MFISWMLIMPSFKKSLIVEQFQGNYLKATEMINAHLRSEIQFRDSVSYYIYWIYHYYKYNSASILNWRQALRFAMDG